MDVGVLSMRYAKALIGYAVDNHEEDYFKWIEVSLRASRPLLYGLEICSTYQSFATQYIV